MLAVDAFLMGCTDKRSARSALDRDPITVDEAVSLMRRFHGHEKALSVERRVRTLVLEEGDPVAPQVNRVQEERSGSLDVGELNENIEKLTKLLANINMAGPGRRMVHVKCFSCGETGHIACFCRSNVQRLYPRPRDGVYVKAARIKDGVEVDLGDGQGNYSMTMYVANITDNCILGFDFLKARKAVIELKPRSISG